MWYRCCSRHHGAYAFHVVVRFVAFRDGEPMKPQKFGMFSGLGGRPSTSLHTRMNVSSSLMLPAPGASWWMLNWKLSASLTMKLNFRPLRCGLMSARNAPFCTLYIFAL